MAEQKKWKTASDFILAYDAEHPNASVNDVMQAAKKEGLAFSRPLVYAARKRKDKQATRAHVEQRVRELEQAAFEPTVDDFKRATLDALRPYFRKNKKTGRASSTFLALPPLSAWKNASPQPMAQLVRLVGEVGLTEIKAFLARIEADA